MQDHRVSFSFPEQIKFTKGPGGFGLRFGGAANQVEGQQFGLGVFIAGVKPGGAGAAADDGVAETALFIPYLWLM